MSIRNLVFLCVQNSARSHMAEGLARAAAPSNLAVWSAGSQPYMLRPQVTTVLAELGIDSRDQRSKGLDEVPLDDSSLVITLCAEEICPAAHGTRSLHWPIADPAGGECDDEGERLERFRTARDQIEARIEQLLLELRQDDH